MSAIPKRSEIDHHVIKLIIGLIAVSLATLTNLFSTTVIDSISASYYQGGWSKDIFVGFLFAIAALLTAYNGWSKTEFFLSKTAAVCAALIALFPCKCGDHVEIIPHLHATAATIMFVVLAIFCRVFYKRAIVKPHFQAKIRAMIYVVCGVVIVLAIATLLYDHMTGGSISSSIPRLTFYGEAASLISFGIAWLTASRTLPVITAREERIPLAPFHSPGSS